jgi:hypothetical protein
MITTRTSRSVWQTGRALGLVLAALVGTLSAGNAARATVIGFDTFTKPEEVVPLDYQGFRWSDGMGNTVLTAINNSVYEDPNGFGNTYGAPSPPYAVFNSQPGGEGGSPDVVVTPSPGS